MKKKFLISELWTLSTYGAFQRANCYKKIGGKDVPDKEKKKFKEKIKDYINNNIVQHYKAEIAEERHLENITSVKEFSSTYGAILVNGSLNFGISQKLLNLYLKYLWITGEINRPPHFPVDRTIQEKLKMGKIKNWTKFEDATDYIKVIDAAKKELVNKKLKLNEEAYKSLADLELHMFLKK